MIANVNITQIIQLMRHVLNFATQLAVTTAIDDTTELKKCLRKRSNNNLL